ncbi:hypothetical protein G7Z17_g13164 [Cylindrodendrum hubeiense]|uniref:xylan 1,4-beta-xylosidase n=1 Tax=Cylindrodendrum hubeiense TaxID=595255 RepID=A0A9P5L2H3_9HYPO|nr:hypothetical protein G7Z17_g13164 [Cylindrodendrum hubeiense]
MPILTSAAFDDQVVLDIGKVISIETRAYNNDGRVGFDLYRVVATCKHYAANDFEDCMGTERYGFDAIITTQELSEYYLPPFKTCAVEKNVGAFMCSYNGINGTPLCANHYLLEDILRQHWNWESDEHYITTDCDCVPLMVTHHKFTDNYGEAAALAMKASTNLECNSTPGAEFLISAWEQGLISEEDVNKALIRLMTALVTVGMFDPADGGQELREIGWDAVNTEAAQQLAYKAAVSVEVTNTGKVASDYVALLFQKNNAGPETLQNFVGLHKNQGYQPGDTASSGFEITLERLVRVDEDGNRVLYPGYYEFFVDLDAKSTVSFTLKGSPVLIEEFPQPRN